MVAIGLIKLPVASRILDISPDGGVNGFLVNDEAPLIVSASNHFFPTTPNHIMTSIGVYSVLSGDREASPVYSNPIPLEKVTVPADFIKNHPYYNTITKDGYLDTSDITSIIEELDFGMHLYATGTVPASTNSHEYNYAWLRDSAICAHALDSIGETEQAVKVISNLNRFLGTTQRHKFLNFVLHYNEPHLAYRGAIDATLALPHIRAGIDQNGELQVCHEPWGHLQLDAIGDWLRITAKMALEGKLDLRKLDENISRLNPDNSSESYLALAIKFLNRVQYWDQTDLGVWESHLSRKRASSIAPCLLGLIRFQRYFEERNWDKSKIINIFDDRSKGYSLDDFKRELSDAISKGKEALFERIPMDGSRAVECNEFPDDAALAFILKYSEELGLNRAQENAILKTLDRLMGEVGFRRRHNDQDNYMGIDYPYSSSRIFSDLNPNHSAAEWPMFDAIICRFHFRRYLRSEGLDIESYALGDKHLRRMIAQITKKEYKIPDSDTPIPARILPEAYYKNTRMHPPGESQWTPNRNSPLGWTGAEYAPTFMMARAAMRLREILSTSTTGVPAL